MSRSSFYDRYTYMNARKGSWDVDPLYNTVIDSIRKLPEAIRFNLRESEEGRPALISFRAYNTVDLWWLVMEYNAIVHHRELVAGILLRLPGLPAIDQVLRQAGLDAQNKDAAADAGGSFVQRRARVLRV